MKTILESLHRVVWWYLVLGVLVSARGVRGADINLPDLTRETQRMSQKPDAVTLVWWIPEEFWAGCMNQNTNATPAQARTLLRIVRPYTIVAVVDGAIGLFGGVTYKSENWIRGNTRLVDDQGKSYVPMTEDEIDGDLKNMLQMTKPVMANMLGPMGQNVHFLLFPGTGENGAQIACAKEKGHFTVQLADREFQWRLPLDSLLAAKFCTPCQRDGKGSWTYCPWCGQSLAQKR